MKELITLLLITSLSTFTIAQNVFVDGLETDSSKNTNYLADTNIVSSDSTLIDTLASDTVIKEGVFTQQHDPRFNDMIDKYVDINKSKCPDIVTGYRIQVFSSSGAGSSQRAREERAKFLTFYPEVPAYNDYDAPNFRVRVGNFRTKLEAEKLKKQIGQEFPGCFIVPDYIETELTKTCKEK